MLPESQLKISLLILVAHEIVESRGRSLVLLPYGTMLAVETTSVVSVVVYDCCERFLLLVACVRSIDHRLESNSTSHNFALSSLQNTRYWSMQVKFIAEIRRVVLLNIGLE